MKHNILYHGLIFVLCFTLIAGSVLLFVPEHSTNAAIAPEEIYCSPIRNGQVISPRSAMSLSVKLPAGCRLISKTWGSSDPKVVSISSVGVLRTKKRGFATVKLRIRYIRSRQKRTAEKSFALEVGTPVSRINLSARSDRIGRGDSLNMICKIAPADASRKNVTWSTSNPEVCTVSQSGKVLGVHSGKSVITARCADGSGISASKEITVYALRATDTNFIAHRGLSTAAPENTVAAFDQAGKAGFWGCECDIRESAPDETGATDLIISHDASLLRMTGVSKRVDELTAQEAAALPVVSGSNHESYDEHICTLSDFLTSCAAYGMVPVIEIKEPDMSDNAYRRIFWALDASHLAEKAIFISFRDETLQNLKRNFEACRDSLDLTADAYPECWLIMKQHDNGLDDAAYAITAGFDGIFLRPEAITEETCSLCQRSSLGLAACTFKARDQQMLAGKLGKFRLSMATTDGKLFE